MWVPGHEVLGTTAYLRQSTLDGKPEYVSRTLPARSTRGWMGASDRHSSPELTSRATPARGMPGPIPGWSQSLGIAVCYPAFSSHFLPWKKKKSESNHKVSHLLFRNIFLLLFPVISKYFSGIIPPHMKRQARCNILHVLTGSTFLGNSCLVD